MNNLETEIKMQLRSRITEIVSIEIPTDTLASLQKIAAIRDMSVEALLKFYNRVGGDGGLVFWQKLPQLTLTAGNCAKL